MKFPFALVALALSLVGCAGPNFAKIVEGHREAAASGEPTAQFQMGLAYDMGRGVEQDYAVAAEWYRKAAEAGYAPAQNSLASMLMAGDGGTQDDVAAVEWFRRAAEQGHADGANSFAYMYDVGRGVEVDNPKAAQLYEEAAEVGSLKAMMNLGVMLSRGEPGVPADPVEAFKWLDIVRFATQTSSDMDLKWRSRGVLDELKKSLTEEQMDEGKRRGQAWMDAMKERAAARQ